MEKEQQELMFKLSMFEQQMQQLQQQMQAVEQAIVEITNLNFGLDELKEGVGKEVLAQIGKGIFAKTKLTSEDLIVDVGGKNLVKKTIPETKKIIEDQIEKLQDAKKQLNDSIEEINSQLTDLIMDAQKKQDSIKK